MNSANVERARSVGFVQGFDAGLLNGALTVHAATLRAALAMKRLGVVDKDLPFRAGHVGGKIFVYALALFVAPFVVMYIAASLARSLSRRWF